MEFAALLGIGTAVVAAIWWFGADNRIKRQLRAAPAFTIGELGEQNVGRVIGRAGVLRDQLVAPLTGRPCVHYIAKVEQRHSSGQSHRWRTIATETRGVPFVLDDGTGRAIVDATAAKIALDFDARSASGFLDAAPNPAQRAFLDRHGTTEKGLLFDKKLRYQEAIIGIGETIAVLGAGTREPDPAADPTDYRGGQPMLLRLTSSARYPLVISDDPSTTRTP